MTFLDLLKAFLPLVLIVGLLYALLRYVKRKGFSFNNKNAGPVKISVVSTKMILPKKYLSVVKVNDKFLVLGVSENSINLVKEMDDETAGPEESVSESEPKNNFIDLFKKNLGIR
jgi:flagellar protein FliO/FliZ